MKRLLVALAVAALAACGGHQYRNFPGDWQHEQVAAWDSCLDIFHCPAFAPWYRAGVDANFGAAYWLVSSQRHACLVAPEVFTMMHTGEFWPCAWRLPRP